MSTTPHGNCLDDEVLLELAGGIGSQELAQQTMKHVAACHACAATLRRYIADLSDEQSPENLAISKQLQSSTPKWQARLVAATVGRRRQFPLLKIAPAALALAVIIFAVAFGPALVAAFSAKKALVGTATAFTQRRTTETRLSGVAYSPFTPFPTTLGPESGRSLDEIPASLQDASSAANQHLQEKNADPRWLQVQGRALLWEATPTSLEKAEKDFEKARSEGLNSASLEIDLAASYFERDSRYNNPNLLRSIDLLNKVLSEPKLSNEDRASALYDLALAYEKTQAWDMALATWEKYLKVDSSSGWANTARQHLKDAGAKISNDKPQSYADPSFFLQQKSQSVLRLEDPELYQQKALTKWLPAAIANKNSDAYRAISGLAETFTEHQDSWWKDFLANTTAQDLDAVQSLSKAVQANEEGSYQDAEEQSRQAAKYFARHHNFAAEVRANFEQVYARRRFLNGSDCIERADALDKILSTTSYNWLSARVALEQADCRNLSGQFTESDERMAVSRHLADQFHYPVLALQTLGISAGMQRLRGNCDESWKQAVAGLELYWQIANARGERLFQFYAVMLQCSLETGGLHTSKALIEHLLAMRLDPSAGIERDVTIDGLLHLHLANILFAQRDVEHAAVERRHALALLYRPGEPSADKYKLTSELEPAEFLLQQGHPTSALSSLSPAIPLLLKSQDKFFPLRCQKLLGDIYFALGNFDEAGKQYQSAIDLAEDSLTGLKDGTKRLAWLRATDESYRGLIRVLIGQKKNDEALRRWEWFLSRPLLQSKRGGEAANIAQENRKTAPELIQALSPRITYAVFKDGLQIWVSEKGHIRSKWVSVDQQDLEQLVHDFVRNCSTGDSDIKEVQAQGSRLYSLLIQPIDEGFREASTTTVELDRRIYNLPLEALYSPEGRYFGENHSVVYSAGVRADLSLNTPRPVTNIEHLLILDATNSSLPGMSAERKTILQVFPQAQVIDASTARGTSVEQSLSQAEIFHYMGHGLAEGTGTGLLFTDARSLHSQDFTPKLFKHSQLVVLAACSTGKGKDGLLDADNLVRALLAAGVPRVIASQWNVDSKATSQLMQIFYRNLRNDKTVAQAMFIARNQVAKQNPHPYYWAGFSLSGLAN